MKRLLRATMSSPDIKKQVVFVLGPPGSGKGTQCAKIVEKFGFGHLSAGELLRIERKSGSENAQLINDICSQGKIVPGHITTGLLAKAMFDSELSHFLVDGFPRNDDNVTNWEKIVGDKADVKMLLFVECTEEECIKRVMQRGKDSGRVDDNMEVLRKRFTTDMTQTKPIVEQYEAAGIVKRVHGARPIDEVFADITKVLTDAMPELTTRE